MNLTFLAAVMLALISSTVSNAKTLNARLVDPPVSLDWGGQVSLSEAPVVVNLC
jgi:hypothetical protein